MKVLIAGGTGFVGQVLCRRLADDGHQVAVLTRNAAGKSLGAGVELHSWPAPEQPVPVAALAGIDAVVNLAGETVAKPWSKEQKEKIRASRVEITRALVRDVLRSTTRPAAWVNASAIGFYGTHGDEVLTEDAPAGSDFLGRVSVEWEAATAGARELGIRVVLARIGVVLGKGGGALEKLVTPFKMFAGGPMGSGRQYMSWIHLQDVVGLIEFALLNEVISGPMNTTAPEPVTNREFAQTLGRVLGRPSAMPAPAFAIKAMLGEMSVVVLEGQRVIPRKALHLGYEFRFPSLEPALRDLLCD